MLFELSYFDICYSMMSINSWARFFQRLPLFLRSNIEAIYSFQANNFNVDIFIR